jgi:hypothetical protein
LERKKAAAEEGVGSWEEEEEARPREAEAEEEEKGKRRALAAEQSLEVSEPLTSALGL